MVQSRSFSIIEFVSSTRVSNLALIRPKISTIILQDYFIRETWINTGYKNRDLAFRFADVAEHYRLISEDTIGAVVATWEEMKEEIERRIALLRRDPSRRNFRELAIYQVTLRTHEAIVRSRGANAD